MSTERTYEFEDATITATFDRPGAVMPEAAIAFLSTAIEMLGGVVTQEFVPCEQTHKADDGYIVADIRIDLPDIGRVWLSIECPTDEAVDGDLIAEGVAR